MTIFKHRPLCIVGILFLTSAILGVSFSFETQIALLVGSSIALVASIVLTLFLTRKAKTAILIFATLFCTLLLMLFRIHLPVQEVKAFEKETETTVVCRITDIPYHNEDYYVCIVKTRVIGATARELPLALTFTSDFPYQIGDTLEARGVIISFEDRYRDYAYYISNGARGLLDASQVSEPTRVSPNLLTYARRLQNGISNHFHSVYEERTASLLSAVMIADKSGCHPIPNTALKGQGSPICSPCQACTSPFWSRSCLPCSPFFASRKRQAISCFSFSSPPMPASQDFRLRSYGQRV